jgi:serine/threonine protein kinase
MGRGEAMKLKHYIVEKDPIGKGVFGKVYRAYDPLKEKTVAIKCSNRKRGEREARIYKKVGKSEYLPILHDFFQKGSHTYLVMDFIKGRKIGYTFRAGKKQTLSQEKSVQITINILKGIHQLHQAGFIHNDIMPKNIMILDDLPRTVNIIDFNRSKEIKSSEDIQKDLRNIARICLFLIKGSAPKQLTGKEINNKELMNILMRAVQPTNDNRYENAKELMEDLLPFA